MLLQRPGDVGADGAALDGLVCQRRILIAVYGLVAYVAQHALHLDPEGEQRLKAIFAEPSLFVYTTLPAMGYYINCWVNERRYGSETLIFLLAYVLADRHWGCRPAVHRPLNLRQALHHLARTGSAHRLRRPAGRPVRCQREFALRVTDTATAIRSEPGKHQRQYFRLPVQRLCYGQGDGRPPGTGVGIGGYAKIL